MSGVLPSQFIDEVKRRVSLSGLVSEYVTLKKAGRVHKGLCPFHGEKTPSFQVNDEQGFYHCFGCGASGDAISFLREQAGYSFLEAAEKLAERAGMELPQLEKGARREGPDRTTKARQLELLREVTRLYQRWLTAAPEAMTYLRDARRLAPETLATFQVGFAPDDWDTLARSLAGRQAEQDGIALGLLAPRERGQGNYDKFRNRIMFPVFAQGGEIVGYSGRTLAKDKDTPKYVNSAESDLFKKSQLLFGLQQAKPTIRAKKRAILVEGNVDVLTLHQAGFSEAVAPMGTALTEDQCRLLKRLTDDVIVCTDGDRAGKKAAMKAVPLLLAAGLRGRVVSLPDGEDPDTFLVRHGAAAFQELCDHKAVPLFDHFVAVAREEGDGTAASNARVAELARPLLMAIESPVERRAYVEKLAVALGADRRALAGLVSAPPAPTRHAAPALAPVAGEKAPAPERDVLALLLHHPEYLPHWHAEQGNAWLSHDGIRLVLDLAWELAEERGRVDGGELLTALELRGQAGLQRRVAQLLAGEDPFGEAAERAFLELVSALRFKADREAKTKARAALVGRPLDEQIGALKGWESIR